MAESIFLVIATSGRAIAQSLKALGYNVVVIDAFADQDTLTAANVCIKVQRGRFGLVVAEVENAIQTLSVNNSFSGLFYDAAIEVNPQLLNLFSDLKIVGNSIDTLRRCKDPHQFFSILDKHSIIYPEIRFDTEFDESCSWILKHRHSTGGIGVSSKINNSHDIESYYLQKMIEGICFSLTFLANGKDIKVLGANTLWQEKLSDEIPYAYAGAINQVKLEKNVIACAQENAKMITKEFDLIGLNSIDFIYNGEDVFVLEVNPRIPASYELYETKYGDLMREHILACNERKLPLEQRQELLRAHAIIYAPYDVKIPENANWPLWTADRPHPGEKILQFEPICNVFSGGKNYSQVCEMIAARKRTVLNKLTTKI